MKIMTATKFKLIFSALVVASAATALVVQHQTQAKLAGDNESLRRQINRLEMDNSGLSNRVATGGNSASTSATSPNNQNNELLKLRGEVGVLRQQMNDANQKAQLAEQKLEAELSIQAKFKKDESATVNAMKNLGLDMRLYAMEHGNQFPTNENLYQLVKDYDGNTNLLNDIPYIEYLNIGAAKFISGDKLDYPNMVTFRERIARQSPGGMWHRIYGFADGSVNTATTTDGNFDAWEKANTYSPSLSQ